MTCRVRSLALKVCGVMVQPLSSSRMRIAVIGGGVIGASISFRLAQRGCQVTLFESKGIGSGATKAAIGGLTPYTDDFCRGGLEWFGTESLRIFPDFLVELSQVSGDVVEIDRTGQLLVALNDSEAEELMRIASCWTIDGVPKPLVSTDRIIAMEPTINPAIKVGFEVPEEPQVDVPALMRCLHSALLKLKVDIKLFSVKELSLYDGSVRLKWEDGEGLFDHVVVAAGYNTNVIVGLEFVPVYPKRGQAVILNSGTRSINHHVYNFRKAETLTEDGYLSCYVAPRAEGRVHIGVSYEEKAQNDQTTAGIVAEILTAAIRLFPHLAKAEFITAVSGLRPVTRDGKPILGPCKSLPRVSFAVGHWGLGVTLAPATADAITRSIVDGFWPASLTAYSAERFYSDFSSR